MAAVGAQFRSTSNPGGVSRLSMMQARYREQLMLEKESRLLEMAARQDAEREDIINRVTKSSANSLSSSMSSLNSSGAGQGRVRKMFEERRNGGRVFHQSPKGIDKGNPLEPVKRDSGGRPAMRGLSQPGRGMSVDRFMSPPDGGGMSRSRSQAPIQRANRGDNRVQKPPKGPPGKRGLPTHHKSTSSLMEPNNYNGYSRGPSPGPPSSTKSSPGPRGPPVAPPRKAHPIKKAYPNDNYLNINGNRQNRNSKSRTPSPTPRDAPPEGKGFFAKLGFNKTTPKPDHSPKPKPAPTPSRSKWSEDEEEDETDDDLGGDDDDDELSVNGKENGGLSAASTPRARSPVPDNLRRCKVCERNFAPDRIEKHEAICKNSKQKQKKRKIFDPVKMRTAGTEAEKFVARGEHLKENKKEKKNNWRKKHEDFIATVRAAKGIKGYEAPPMDTSDYIVCPHCGRKFSEAVADRHIPKCENIQSNKAGRQPGPPAKGPAGRRR